ncbi:hypothetical protein [Halalkalibacter okhensis]|uniref:Uncharacterized protein n=1 Tax=Halalkalibacter okhensis TaxID=333138 RepID=A0A0B0IGP1_9BACI|nr:hypothetical protein [Halalkalibacter okhensis]KHF40047.1 hypothetical protein LQ50_12255 [Halalkalibacter okhensis]
MYQRLYEGMMLILVMITLMTLWTNHAFNPIVNWIVWGIFVMDFLYRMMTTPNKWLFIKQNPFLVIAIIPLDQFFQIARLVRIVYLFRMKTVAKYYIQPSIDRLSYVSKLIIILLIIVFLCIQSLVIWVLEDSILSIGEAVYYISQHLLFFGQRIVEVDHGLSLFIFVLTTIIGVLLHGMALQWLFQQVDRRYRQFKKNRIKSTSKEEEKSM